MVAAIIGHYIGDDPDADPIAKVPAPETDTAGAGVRPPGNCLDSASRFSLIDSLPGQDHHILTNKHSKWTPLFEEWLAEHFPGRTLNEGWNIIENMPHEGKRHAPAYHYWTARNFEKALRESNGDWSTFERLWDAWVRDVVVADPTVVRREYWDC